MRSLSLNWQSAALTTALATLCACAPGGHLSTGGRAAETIRESRVIERQKAAHAEQIQVDLNMHAGELRLSGGAAELLEADFAYDNPAWKPEVRLDGASFRARLSVRQPGDQGTLDHFKNEWKLKLGNGLPLDLNLHCGAGENSLDLRQLTLRGVDVSLGAGQVDIQLGPNAQKDYQVRVQGGVGEATIHVPKEVGVIASAAGGIGSVETRGMTKEGGQWHNAAYGKSRATIRLDVKGGIGQINILSE